MLNLVCIRDITDKATEFVSCYCTTVFMGCSGQHWNKHWGTNSFSHLSFSLFKGLNWPSLYEKATLCLLNFSGNFRCTDFVKMPPNSWSGATKCPEKYSVALSVMSVFAWRLNLPESSMSAAWVSLWAHLPLVLWLSAVPDAVWVNSEIWIWRCWSRSNIYWNNIVIWFDYASHLIVNLFNDLRYRLHV